MIFEEITDYSHKGKEGQQTVFSLVSSARLAALKTSRHQYAGGSLIDLRDVFLSL